MLSELNRTKWASSGMFDQIVAERWEQIQSWHRELDLNSVTDVFNLSFSWPHSTPGCTSHTFCAAFKQTLHKDPPWILNPSYKKTPFRQTVQLMILAHHDISTSQPTSLHSTQLPCSCSMILWICCYSEEERLLLIIGKLWARLDNGFQMVSSWKEWAQSWTQNEKEGEERDPSASDLWLPLCSFAVD